jgi:hypothetical protein
MSEGLNTNDAIDREPTLLLKCADSLIHGIIEDWGRGVRRTADIGKESQAA